MNWRVARVLALSPHTDDYETGAGGLIARLVESGAEVLGISFSIARESVPDGFPDDVLEREVRAAGKVLGIPEERILTHDYPVRHLPSHRQEILEELVKIGREWRPDLVLVHSSSDVHQDHATVHAEAVRAFKKTTVLGYELPWNNIVSQAQMVVKLEERHIERKVEALAEFRSQQHRQYVDAGVFRGLARVRGTAIGADFAEAFEVVRWVVN